MREGGQRVVVIPADKAYGPNPPAQSPIAPDESLIYVVEVLAVENPLGADGG
jgi:FKBP-type peptidyl-prolyl cis-trans isomerase